MQIIATSLVLNPSTWT